MGDAKYTEANISNQMVAAAGLIKALSSDDDDLKHDMVEGETGLFEAIGAALDEITECEINIVGLTSVISEMTERKSRNVNRKDKLKGLIHQAMSIAEIKSHQFTCQTITVKTTPVKAIITDESLIPSKYFTPQEPKLDKKALLGDLKNGKVSGAEKSNGGSTLQIRKS